MQEQRIILSSNFFLFCKLSVLMTPCSFWKAVTTILMANCAVDIEKCRTSLSFDNFINYFANNVFPCPSRTFLTFVDLRGYSNSLILLETAVNTEAYAPWNLSNSLHSLHSLCVKNFWNINHCSKLPFSHSWSKQKFLLLS